MSKTETELYELRNHHKVSEYRTEMLRHFMERRTSLLEKLTKVPEECELVATDYYGRLHILDEVLTKL